MYSLETLKQFPGEEWINRTCKPQQGAISCRYLAGGRGGLFCARYSDIRIEIDKRMARRTFRAQGDNCKGILPIIAENRDQLRGKRFSYEETSPRIVVSGVVDNIIDIISEGDRTLRLHGRVGDKLDEPFDGFLAEETYGEICNSTITVLENRIIFGRAGIGTFLGETTIYL